MTARPGTVYLVGAGPGDPGLITARGLELLRRADVVLYDRLVGRALLEEAPPFAVMIDVGKRSLGDTDRQEAINADLVRLGRAGKIVVRLKGGDPLLFGRGWEELEACQRGGVPCEIVPGIPSAIAGPAAAGIPVTRRGVASSVAIVAAPVVDDAELQSLAKADTGVVLMGVHALSDLAARLIAAGRSGSTPAAVIERATLPGQRTVRATLETIGAAAAAAGCRPPAIVVIGRTVETAQPVRGPLAGRRIVLTRPPAASHELAGGLRALGADVISSPLIEIVPCAPRGEGILERIEEYDWIVFSSRHGVRGFRRALASRRRDARSLSRARLAVVGPVTKRELETWGLMADLEANPARADALVDALLAHVPRPTRVLFPCGTLALDTIPDALESKGIPVDRLTAYETRRLSLDPRSHEAIEAGVDAVLLASPSAVTALGQSRVNLGQSVVICIGPTTAAAAAGFGWDDVRVAVNHSDAGMIALTVEALGVTAAV